MAFPGTPSRPSVLDEWAEPHDFEHAELRPSVMASIEQYPTSWLVVEQYVHRNHDSDGVSTVLITSSARAGAFEEPSWSGTDLGEFGLVNNEEVVLGLTTDLGDGHAEFFCQLQKNHGMRPPTVEIAYPFLWFWDAIRDGNDWFYLDSAGREQPLIRTTLDEADYTVEVRALEFRRYLQQRGLLGLTQRDHVRWANVKEFEPVDLAYRSEWCSFAFNARHGQVIAGQNSHSRLLGQSVVTGIQGKPMPAWLDYGNETYGEFIIGVEPESGSSITHTSDPDLLANYFGKNPDAPHYLTNVQFDQKVLDRYLDEPDRYVVSSTRLAAVDMWSVSIGRTSTGDVEIYLGDLGRDLPWQEHPHWKAHNIVPRGDMNQDRYKRDFLGQWAGDMDPLEVLRNSLASANAAAERAWGQPLFRPLGADEAQEFQRLHPPVHDGKRTLVQPILLLTKALVDAINVKLIKEVAGTSESRSVMLLGELVTHLGGDASITDPIRDLNRLRSSGGVAHLANESRAKLLASIGLEGLNPAETINTLATRLSVSLSAIADRVAIAAESSHS
ncbi:hypothetical protein [Cryobacterium sp. W22_MBD10_FK3]|uniref:hypothetical protein n=1 Tax=Cryobacterium sp. W22_MBD10_FK3 TaxID=3240273 RepID=UPI003F928534